MELSEFLNMQHELAVEKGWIADRNPEHAPLSLLWSIDELGEAISIIKKKGSEGIMENPAVREHFIEEVADHLMYVFDMMESYSITAEEFTDVYVKKFDRNLGRSWTENDRMYENTGVTKLIVTENYLPDERLWELLLRAGVNVTVVAANPDEMTAKINSLVNDSAKVVVTDEFPETDGAMVVDDPEALVKLKEIFGEE